MQKDKKVGERDLRTGTEENENSGYRAVEREIRGKTWGWLTGCVGNNSSYYSLAA